MNKTANKWGEETKEYAYFLMMLNASPSFERILKTYVKSGLTHDEANQKLFHFYSIHESSVNLRLKKENQSALISFLSGIGCYILLTLSSGGSSHGGTGLFLGICFGAYGLYCLISNAREQAKLDELKKINRHWFNTYRQTQTKMIDQ